MCRLVWLYSLSDHSSVWPWLDPSRKIVHYPSRIALPHSWLMCIHLDLQCVSIFGPERSASEISCMQCNAVWSRFPRCHSCFYLDRWDLSVIASSSPTSLASSATSTTPIRATSTVVPSSSASSATTTFTVVISISFSSLFSLCSFHQ